MEIEFIWLVFISLVGSFLFCSMVFYIFDKIVNQYECVKSREFGADYVATYEWIRIFDRFGAFTVFIPLVVGCFVFLVLNVEFINDFKKNLQNDKIMIFYFFPPIAMYFICSMLGVKFVDFLRNEAEKSKNSFLKNKKIREQRLKEEKKRHLFFEREVEKIEENIPKMEEKLLSIDEIPHFEKDRLNNLMADLDYAEAIINKKRDKFMVTEDEAKFVFKRGLG